MSTPIVILLVMLVNLGISWLNCWSCGHMWKESKIIGGWMRVLVWCGAIQAAIGFSSALMILLVAVAYGTGHLPPEYVKHAFSLWYLLVIFPALGTGLLITIHSLAEAWRERSAINIGIATWNTMATAKNIYDAANGGISSAWGDVGKLFSSSDSDDASGALVMLVLLIVAASLAGGILLTWVLIRHYAAKHVVQPAMVHA